MDVLKDRRPLGQSWEGWARKRGWRGKARNRRSDHVVWSCGRLRCCRPTLCTTVYHVVQSRSMSTRIFPAIPTLTDGAANGIIYATLGLVLILTIGFFLQSRENRKNATDKVLERAHAFPERNTVTPLTRAMTCEPFPPPRCRTRTWQRATHRVSSR